MPNAKGPGLSPESALLARMMIDITGTVRENYWTGEGRATFDHVFIGMAVKVGHVEGKGMTASGIAGYLDIPRTTVLRRLDELCVAGIVHKSARRYWMVEDAVNSQRAVEATARVTRIVKRAARELSKPDTSTE